MAQSIDRILHFIFASVNPISIQNLFPSFLLHLSSVILTHLGDPVEAFPANLLQIQIKLTTVKSWEHYCVGKLSKQMALFSFSFIYFKAFWSILIRKNALWITEGKIISVKHFRKRFIIFHQHFNTYTKNSGLKKRKTS